MSEEIKIGNETYRKGDVVEYTKNNGEVISCIVDGKSEDNDPGLILNYQQGNRKTKFALNATAVKIRVKKKDQQNK